MHLRFNVFKESGMGVLELTDQELTMILSRTYHVKPSYVSAVEQTSELSMDRVGVKLEFFDLFGNKEAVLFAMHASELRTLKKALGK